MSYSFLLSLLAQCAGTVLLYLASPKQHWLATPLAARPARALACVLLLAALAGLLHSFQLAAALFVFLHVLMLLLLLLPYCGAWLVLRRRA
jgi:hypothetical protein